MPRYCVLHTLQKFDPVSFLGWVLSLVEFSPKAEVRGASQTTGSHLCKWRKDPHWEKECRGRGGFFVSTNHQWYGRSSKQGCDGNSVFPCQRETFMGWEKLANMKTSGVLLRLGNGRLKVRALPAASRCPKQNITCKWGHWLRKRYWAKRNKEKTFSPWL